MFFTVSIQKPGWATHPNLPRASPVLPVKIWYPRNYLSPGQLGTVSHPPGHTPTKVNNVQALISCRQESHRLSDMSTVWATNQSLIKSWLNLLQDCFCFCFGSWVPGMWDLHSATRDRTHTPCVRSWSLYQWTSRRVPSFISFWLEARGISNICFETEDRQKTDHSL